MPTFQDRPITDLEVDNVDPSDYPDFCDAHICSATWADTGEPLADRDIELLNEQYPELVNELAFEHYM